MQLVVGTYERFLLGYSLPDGCLKGVTAGSGDDEKVRVVALAQCPWALKCNLAESSAWCAQCVSKPFTSCPRWLPTRKPFSC